MDRALLELTAIFENASVGIVFTRNRRIERCNGRVAEIFGYPAVADLVGQQTVILFPDAASYERIGHDAGPPLAAGRSFHRDAWQLRRADGTPVWCSLYARAVDPAQTDAGTVWVLEDVTALRQTRREMDAIMHNAPVGIGFTRERRIVRYNARWAEMFGFDGDEAVGRLARVTYVSDEAYDAVAREAGPLLSAGKPFQTEHFMRRKDGSTFWTSMIGYLQDPENPAAGTIWIFEDRTAARQAQQELRDAKERAEAANRAKSLFLANMSHELRTPLNAVIGFAQILRLDSNLDARQLGRLTIIEQSGEHLLTLINDVLDLAKIEAGKLELYPTAVTLSAFLNTLADICRIRADQKKLLFSHQPAPDLPRVVKVDERRLRQVLLNLVGNAIKFTAQGEVALRVAVLRQGAGSARILFQVRDSGVGIAAENLEAIFKPFMQVGDLTQRVAGTGLGLPISRQLVRAMGGDIRVSSTPGVGSVFAFELELPVVADAPPATAVQRLPVGYEGARKTVLVVDDVAENRALVTDVLARLGFTVREAGNGLAALQSAQELQPDLILMDHVMPVMDGLEAIRRLRQLAPFARVPIVAVSASAFEEDAALALAAGSDGFLAKPLAVHDLIRVLGERLHLTWRYD